MASLTAERQFVRSDPDVLRRALVVRPTHEVEQVPPVQGEPSPIADRALDEFEVLIRRLRGAGVETTVYDGETAHPLGCAAADIAVVLQHGAVMMRPSDLSRHREVSAMEDVFGKLGIPVIGRIDTPGLLDGGDVLVGRDHLYVGVPERRLGLVGIPTMPRSNLHGRKQLAEIAGTMKLDVIEVAVAADVRRLRSVAALLDEESVLVAHDVVDSAAFGGRKRIDVPRGDDYGAGVLPLGARRALGNFRFASVKPLLRKAGFTLELIDLWEFGKIGFTPSSLVLALARG